MTTVQKWTGRETRMLRHALRMSIRDFAEHLGVSERTVSKWEAGREAVQPRPEIQAALDTALARAGNEVHRRFRSGLGLADAAELRQGAADIQAEGNGGTSIADVTAVFRNRAELSAHLPADRILDGARKVRAMGLSLNLLCQHYTDHRWRQLIEGGAQVRCLFLDPDGSAIQAREREESFPAGQLAALTKLNIETMLRVRDRLSGDLYGNVQSVVVPDEPQAGEGGRMARGGCWAPAGRHPSASAVPARPGAAPTLDGRALHGGGAGRLPGVHPGQRRGRGVGRTRGGGACAGAVAGGSTVPQ